jgi:hypothetical protein
MARVAQHAGGTWVEITASSRAGGAYPVLAYAFADAAGRRRFTEIACSRSTGISDAPYVFDRADVQNDPVAERLLPVWKAQCRGRPRLYHERAPLAFRGERAIAQTACALSGPCSLCARGHPMRPMKTTEPSGPISFASGQGELAAALRALSHRGEGGRPRRRNAQRPALRDKAAWQDRAFVAVSQKRCTALPGLQHRLDALVA